MPINDSIRIELEKFLAVTSRGHKLFVPEVVQTHHTIAQLQQYIYKVRPQIQDEDSTRPMTHYGLRHNYAARTWRELLDSGVSPLNASLRVSQLLGHERPDVTHIYLGLSQLGGADPEHQSGQGCVHRAGGPDIERLPPQLAHHVQGPRGMQPHHGTVLLQ